jgi:hypothetical protein
MKFAAFVSRYYWDEVVIRTKTEQDDFCFRSPASFAPANQLRFLLLIRHCVGSFEFRTLVHVDIKVVWDDKEVFYLTTFFSC